jgi:hypothetical protein
MKITALDGSRAALSDRAYCQSHRSVTTTPGGERAMPGMVTGSAPK